MLFVIVLFMVVFLFAIIFLMIIFLIVIIVANETSWGFREFIVTRGAVGVVQDKLAPTEDWF